MQNSSLIRDLIKSREENDFSMATKEEPDDSVEYTSTA